MSNSGPRQDRAARRLQRFAVEHAGQQMDAKELLELLIEIDRLAALDLADCRSDKQRQKVYPVIAGAVMHVVRATGGQGDAAGELYDALTNLALGVPGDDRLHKGTIPKQHPVTEDAIRAAIIVGIERYPNQRDHIVECGARLLSKKPLQVRRFIENFHGGKIKSAALTNNVEYFRQVAESGDTWPFEGLMEKNTA